MPKICKAPALWVLTHGQGEQDHLFSCERCLGDNAEWANKESNEHNFKLIVEKLSPEDTRFFHPKDPILCANEIPDRAQINAGRVCVETGQLLIIDPCFLFSRDEWIKAIRSGPSAGDNHQDVVRGILKALAERSGRSFDTLNQVAVVSPTGGDMVADVVWDETGIQIRQAAL